MNPDNKDNLNLEQKKVLGVTFSNKKRNDIKITEDIQ